MLLLVSSVQGQTTIHVPADQASIQAGINAAANGDTVLVAPATYLERINFSGKNITVRSSGGASVTFIDGSLGGPVVSIASGESAAATLQGFTIQHGYSLTGVLPSFGAGGGIWIKDSSPKILDNVVKDNQACQGLGIALDHSAALVQGNTVTSNVQAGCSGGIGGGGISVLGSGPAQIIQNVISGNVLSSANGGGISLFGAGAVVVRDNTIRDNSTCCLSPATQGGGIWIVNDTSAVIIQNLIVGNTAGQGGGIFVRVPLADPDPPPTVTNNTIVDNNAVEGSALWASVFNAHLIITNNLLIGRAGDTAVYCSGVNNTTSPIWNSNDVYAPSGTNYGGICTDQSGINGNISADPLFVNQAGRDFHLAANSPAIDAGDSAVPNLPAQDFEGNPRLLDGNADCTAAVDMGVYERVSSSLNLSSASLTFATQLVTTASGSTTVTLTNPGTTAIHICGIAITGDFSQTNSCGATLGAGASCTINVTYTPTAGGAQSGSLTITDSAAGSPQVIPLSGTGVDFVVSISPTAQTVNHGQSATYTVTVTPQGGVLNLPISLACPNLPAGLACSFASNPVTPGANPGTSTLTVGTAAVASLEQLPGRSRWASLAALLFIPGMLPLVFALRRPSRRGPSRFFVVAALIAISLPLASCGGGGKGGGLGPTPHTFTVTVGGTSGTVQRTASATLTVH